MYYLICPSSRLCFVRNLENITFNAVLLNAASHVSAMSLAIVKCCDDRIWVALCEQWHYRGLTIKLNSNFFFVTMMSDMIYYYRSYTTCSQIYGYRLTDYIVHSRPFEMEYDGQVLHLRVNTDKTPASFSIAVTSVTSDGGVF